MQSNRLGLQIAAWTRSNGRCRTRPTHIAGGTTILISPHRALTAQPSFDGDIWQHRT